MGRCPDCGQWNSLVEERQERSQKAGINRYDSLSTITEPVYLNKIEIRDADRITTSIIELDRVLGGGIVSGSLVLIGGDPGIGKSTIMLQMLHGIFKTVEATLRVDPLREDSRSEPSRSERLFAETRFERPASGKQMISETRTEENGNMRPALYVSAEESLKQIKLRAQRMDINISNIMVLSETCIENIFEHVKEIKPSIIIIDSIQTVYTQDLSSAQGSIGQVRESASKLMTFAKSNQIPVFIVGHVTKEGAIAGPRVLEHIVDTVLYFEGDRGHAFRVLRTVKNRFGPTNEIGVFEMRDRGLFEVKNPSELFLSERYDKAAGRAVVSTIEGTRPIMLEVQALVSQTTFGIPRRTGLGIDINRANLLVAVLEKVGGLHLGGMDIFINVVGGLKITEPAFDLGIISAIASSFKNKQIKESTFVFGEVGLSGEVRAASQAEPRIKEGEKIGFKKVVLPYSNLERLNIKPKINTIGVKNIDEAIKTILDN